MLIITSSIGRNPKRFAIEVSVHHRVGPSVTEPIRTDGEFAESIENLAGMAQETFEHSDKIGVI